MLGPAQTGKHEADHRQIDHDFPGVSLTLVIAVEAAIAPEPAEGTFHDPASRKHLEPVAVGALHDLDRATPQSLGPLDQGARVAAVGPDVFDAPARRLGKERGEQLPGSIAILNVGGQERHEEHEADRVDQEMALATIDLLAGVVAPLVAGLGALDTLAVEDGRTGMSVATFDQAHVFPQVGVNLRPQPVALPYAEVVVDRPPRGEVGRQVAPLARRLDQIEDRVEELAEQVLARTSLLGRLGETIVDEVPFGVAEIRCVSHPKFVKGCGTRYKLSLKESEVTFQTGS